MRFVLTIALVITIATFSNTQLLASSTGNVQENKTNHIKNISYNKKNLTNKMAYIPSQCYTKTISTDNKISNPCYACHTKPRRPNFLNDDDLQLTYGFVEDARKNPWKNLFKDRTQAISKISDKTIERYISTSNYFDQNGNIKLKNLGHEFPQEWDFNGNGQWDGFIPDTWFNFDTEGFDRDQNGNYTGWRSFAYYPFLGTFWPTNGSTDDVLIRLPEHFRVDSEGRFDKTIYKVNLAILEALLKEQDIKIDPVDEASLDNVDINKDGNIGMADKIVYDWSPLNKRFMWYVGKAHELQKQNKVKIAAGLFPVGTEFLHSVRYIDFDKNGNVTLAQRIKELRYTRKQYWQNYSQLRENVDREFKEKHDFPDRVKRVLGNHEKGISNGQGWIYAAYIEDKSGQLRPQTYEELVFCAGCHGGIGGNRDGIFSFERKFNHDAFQNGWYHWTQKSIKGVSDPLRKDGKHEYAHYLAQNNAGDEFRANEEVINNFFDRDGNLQSGMIAKLTNDITTLLWPSEERAMELNKAYKLIVDEQSYIHGRDAIVKPPKNVHNNIDEAQKTGIESPIVAEKLMLYSNN